MLSKLSIDILPAILIVVALNLDAFTACLAYGAERIRVCFLSLFVVNLVSVGCFVLALGLGSWVSGFVSYEVCKLVAFCILLFMGVGKLLDFFVRLIVRKVRPSKEWSFSWGGLKIFLAIFVDPTSADKDGSRNLSVWEAVSLALALSVDNLAVGFGVAMQEIGIAFVGILAFLWGMLACFLGLRLGGFVAKRNAKLSWVSGILLILLALVRFF